MHRTSLALLAALAASAVLWAPSPAAADDGDVAWSMTPVITNVGEERTSFAYAVDAGEQVSDAVLVRNAGADELTLDVAAADALTDEIGRLEIADAEPDGAGAWIRPELDELTIAPGDTARLPFSVAVPDDAEPGEHAAALLTVLESSGDAVSADMRYATRVTVEVAGDLRASLRLADGGLAVETGFWPWDPASAEVAYTAQNAGNTRLSAAQLIRMQDVELISTAGSAADLHDLEEMLPAAEVTVRTQLDGLSSWSPFFRAAVAVSPVVPATASGTAPVVEQQTLAIEALAIAPGWWMILAAAVLVVAVIVTRVARARKRSRPDESADL
ncbi:COG1470 family protein [Microbacterium sp. gxy059]|uniref:COG1470 family protein n=1 Tax=Microbacterium sp. gxy059 TaxID=2957199 RepID=UPI003D99BE7D